MLRMDAAGAARGRAPDAYRPRRHVRMKTTRRAALTPDAAPGVSFVTHARGERAPPLPLDAGFRRSFSPGSTTRRWTDIVRFRSRGRAGGKHRSLVRTAATPSSATTCRRCRASPWAHRRGRQLTGAEDAHRRLYTAVVGFRVRVVMCFVLRLASTPVVGSFSNAAGSGCLREIENSILRLYYRRPNLSQTR